MPSSNKSDFALGAWNALTDTWTQLLDLNDNSVFSITHGGLLLPQPKKTIIKSGNVRSPGVVIPRIQYQERHITCEVAILKSASTTAILSTIRTLIGIIENPPFCIRLALPGSSSYSYADVLACEHDIPNDPQQILALALNKLHMDFTCAVGLRGDRVTLSNLVYNPGFQAPSGPGVTVFNDTFANANAYSSQAGGAPTAGSTTTTFSELVMGFAPTRYYEFGEPSGTTAYDSSGNAGNGTYTACTLGTSSLASGNNGDKAVTLNGTSSLINIPTSGLPTGSNSWSVACLVQIASAPAGNASVWSMGSTSGTKTGIWCQVNSSRQVQVALSASATTTAGTISTGAPHLIVVTWDGTTLKIYVDNNAAVTATPGALALTYTSGGFDFGANFNTGTPSQFYPGILDEGIIWTNTAISAATVTALYTGGISGSGYVAIGNVLSVASGARAAFGSPAWSAYNTWQMRFRWVSGLTFNSYLHYTDANNYLRVQMTFSTLKLTHNIAGVSTDLASITLTQAMSPNFWYWLKVTQFPQPALTGSNLAPGVTATIFSDSSGAVGSQYSNATTGTVATQDSVTALLGRPQLEASGATALLGGNQTNQFLLSLFGPGAWSFTGTNGGSTGVCSGGWELDTTKTYPSGPVTSYGAARIDMAPAGTMGAVWQNYSGGAVAGTYAMPVGVSGDVVYASIYAKTNSVGASSTLKLNLLEYDSGGTLKATTTLQTVTGGTTASGWQQLSGHATTGSGGTTAYCGLQVLFTDANASASANGILWLDNAQCWDATTTNSTSMPYCELRFPQSPAQLLVSGLLGDMKAPAHLALGTYLTSWTTGSTLRMLCGRRASSGASPLMVGGPFQPFGPASYPPVISSSAYGGWYLTALAGAPIEAIALGYHVSDMQGYYHLYTLVQSANASPAANVTLQVFLSQKSVQFYGGTTYASATGPTTYPVSTQNTWTLADAGQVAVPAYAQGALVDTTANYSIAFPVLADAAGSPQALQMGWQALIPVDSEFLSATLNNPPGASNLTNSYLYVYADGLVTSRGGPLDAAAWTFSTSSALALPTPSAGVGGTGANTSAYSSININAASDTFLTLDPGLDSGSSASQLGVNELCAILVDGAGTVLQLATELRYSPLYLYPR